MKELVFLLEEPSMREFLNVLLPRLLPANVVFKLIAHEGKRDLEKSIPRKLRAWQNPNAHFIILHDQDSRNCVELKESLSSLCQQVLFSQNVTIRIVCRELESWFLGDFQAIEKTYPCKLPKNKAKYRDPDKIDYPKEVLKRLVKTYQPRSGARAKYPPIMISV